MTNRRTFLAAAVAAAVLGRSAFAADKKDEPKKEGEWEKLGTKEAGKKEERDVFTITTGHRYTALSFRVEKGDLEIEDVKVTFDDDTTFSPDTKLKFHEGEKSGKIDLPGNSRAIKAVRFLYRATGKTAATLDLYGKLGAPAKK